MAMKLVRCKICSKDLQAGGLAQLKRKVADHLTFYHPEEWANLTAVVAKYKEIETAERKKIREAAASVTTDSELLIDYFLQYSPMVRV